MKFLPTEIDRKRVYAGFWRRFGAALIDYLLIIPFVFLFHNLKGITIPIAIIAVVINYTLFSFYTIYFNYRFGGTLGKLAVKIRITCPDGSKIGLKEASLRSSVDIIFSFFAVLAEVIAITASGPEQYLNSGFAERAKLIMPLFPAWHAYVSSGSNIWYWSELFVLLFNKRKRAIHDYIAGTVVIHGEYAEQGTQQASAYPARAN